MNIEFLCVEILYRLITQVAYSNCNENMSRDINEGNTYILSKLGHTM